MERRIEVRLDGMEQAVEWESAGCSGCEPDYGTEYVDASLADVLHAAEVQGLDLGREFRMLAHLPFGYVEFWQEPNPAPNDAWAEQPVLEAAS